MSAPDSPPRCPLHELPMLPIGTRGGRTYYACAKRGCSIEMDFPAPETNPTETNTPCPTTASPN